MDTKRTWEETCEILAEYVGVSDEALQLAYAVGGCNIETSQRILFYYTGWNSFDGFLNDLEEDE